MIFFFLLLLFYFSVSLAHVTEAIRTGCILLLYTERREGERDYIYMCVCVCVYSSDNARRD